MAVNESEKLGNSNVEYASVSTRLCAGLYDWLLSLMIGFGIALILGIAVFVLGAITHDPSDGGDLSGIAGILITITFTPIIASVRYALLAFRVAKEGSTPGHDRHRISIEAIDGNPLGRWQAFKRQLIGSPVALISSIWIVFWIVVWEIPQFILDIFDVSYGRWEDASVTLITIALVASLIGALVLAIANHVQISFDCKGRGWHDRLFDTVVIKRRYDYEV